MTLNKSYIFPDPIDPGRYRCIRVYIPDHLLYYSAFWNAYQYFTMWTAWEPDDLKQGKDVAAIWKTGFDMARAGWDAKEDCELRLRQNPDNPCWLEQSHDGGETWTLAFDYAKCENMGPLADPAWPDPPADAYQNILNLIKPIVQCVVDNAGDRDAGIECIQSLVAPFTPGVNTLGAAAQLYDRLLAEGNLLIYTLDCGYVPHRECFINSVNVLEIDAFTQLGIDMIQCLDALGDAIYMHIHDFIMWLGSDFLRALTFQGGGGHGEEFEQDCLWTHTFEFDAGAEGWQLFAAPYYTPETGGTLQAGYWDPTLRELVSDPNNNYGCHVDIIREFPTRRIANVTLEYEIVAGNAAASYHVSGEGGDTEDDFCFEFIATGTPGIFEASCDVDQDIGMLRVLFAAQKQKPDPCISGNKLMRITISGLGTDPFI